MNGSRMYRDNFCSSQEERNCPKPEYFVSKEYLKPKKSPQSITKSWSALCLPGFSHYAAGSIKYLIGSVNCVPQSVKYVSSQILN